MFVEHSQWQRILTFLSLCCKQTLFLHIGRISVKLAASPGRISTEDVIPHDRACSCGRTKSEEVGHG